MNIYFCQGCFSKYINIINLNKIVSKPNCLSPCGCLFCVKCANKIIEKQAKNCPICKLQINIKKITVLNQELISLLFENQDSNIKKIQQCLKIQKKNKAQYINYMEHKIKSLTDENKNLKKYIMLTNKTANNKENIKYLNTPYYTTNNINDISSNSCNLLSTGNSSYNLNNSNIFKTPNVADRNSNLKRIEIKKSNDRQSSIKYSPYINKCNENLKNIKNLNAQTAFEQQYSSKQGNNINVNINNDNSNRRSINFSIKSNNNSIEKKMYNQGNLGKYNRY